MSIARIYLLVAAFVALAVTGIAAAPAHSRSTPDPADGEACPAARLGGGAAAAADLLGGGPRPKTVCKPGTGCCFWISVSVCGLCSPNCSSPVAGDDA